MFVDDLLLCGNGTTKEAKCLASLIQTFSSTLCMEINKYKSLIRFHLIAQVPYEMMQKLLPFGMQPFHSSLLYLGFRLKPKNYLIKDWSWLEVHVKPKILH